MTLVATSSQTVGPFFHFGLTPDGVINAAPLPDGVARIELRVRVTDGDGQPVPDAAVEIWYAVAGKRDEPSLFARLPTAHDGTCTFQLAQPDAHVNVCFFARGLLRQLHTRIYFDGDRRLAQDPALALVAEERRNTLLARQDAARQDRWLFDLRLQGASETVFFDV